ncbi:MAG: tRNA (adenosine(37)-N6)-threonylcarbamoyltransferase complex ATPase subunit type 1 TsaE [Prevotellaceae bacterium]|jgi:tRNA threonylcarbamoyladenosine biosynthesis protein TsaE|nr:tRNA (adenosine(37)-N6)-threonylcarbamoyltransferase complex ATPase subunit type 1 TsaE [Prevotellaceae bacterium]
MAHIITIDTPDAISAAARKFIGLMRGRKLFAFYGAMGAGKTTFIKALCEALGVEEDMVNSPTFSIINEYATTSGETIYHFDFYRITRTEDALDLGLYDYFDSQCFCLMEWAENIAALLPNQCVSVHITVSAGGERVLMIED